MQPTDHELSQWEVIIADVIKTDVPLECIKKVIIKLAGKRQRTINLHNLARQGLSMDEIETMLSRILAELEPNIRDIDFVVDIKSVMDLVKPETAKLLNHI